MLHPVVGALSAAFIVGILSFIRGDLLNLGVVVGFMLIGIGVGMVVARYGRMGTFQGEFGSPWFEANLSDMLHKEIARAARFDRDLSIVVVRQTSGPQIDWTGTARRADDVVSCRNGWQVLVLPETVKDGAQRLIERASDGEGVEVQAIIMDPSVTHLDPDKLGEALLELVRNPPLEDERPVVVRRDTDRLRWPVS